MGENMLVSNMEVYESWQAPIIDAEQYLMDTCKEYYIDYTTCECKERPVTEGLVSGFVNLVKTIFQKAIAFLVKIWKAIVGFFKKIVTSVINFIKRVLGLNKDKPKKVKVQSYIISKPGTVENKTFTSKEDMCRKYKDSFNTFTTAINKHQKMNIELVKQQEKLSIKSVKESMEFVNERVGYNTGVENLKFKNDLYNDIYHFKIDLSDPDIDEDDKERAAEFMNNRYRMLNDFGKEDSNTQGNSYAEHISVANINFLKSKRMQEVLEAKDITEAYNIFCGDSIDDFFEFSAVGKGKMTEEQYKNGELTNLYIVCNKINSAIYDCLKMADAMAEMRGESRESEFHIEEFKNRVQRCVDSRIDEWFPMFYDVEPGMREQAIRAWLNLRINWNKGIIYTLTQMLKMNKDFLSITNAEMDAIIKDLENEDFDSTRKLLDSNMSRLLSPDHKILDARPIGLGMIIISDKMAEESFKDLSSDEKNNNWGWKVFANNMHNVLTSDDAITYLTKYDLTILSHGDSENGRWTIERIISPKGIYIGNTDMIDTVEYLRQCIKEGFKKINLLSCNPGHHKLPQDMLSSNKYFIRMSMNNTLAI